MLEEIEETGFGSAAFLSYGMDLSFFDSQVMGRLQETGCRNVVAICDGRRLADELNAAAGLRYVGVQCPVIPVQLAGRAFHPKAVLMAGDDKVKLLIGSGNLTVPGYTRNWEMFSKLQGEEALAAVPELLRCFEKAAEDSPVRAAFGAWYERLERSNPWVLRSQVSNVSPLPLLCSADGPILERAIELLQDREVDRVTVASPFFDADGAALSRLIERTEARELVMLVDEGTSLDPQRTEHVLSQSGAHTRVLRFEGAGRPLHGKAVLFEGPWGEALLTGSPNLTSAAMLSTAHAGGNFELATVRFGEQGALSPLLEEKAGDEVDLGEINARKPVYVALRADPLGLEAVWVSHGSIYAAPAVKPDGDREMSLRLERHGRTLVTLALQKTSEDLYAIELAEELFSYLGTAPTQARLEDGAGRMGVPVWVQHLDAIERKANPTQRARYAKGLRALGEDSLGLDQQSWDQIFDAFLALSGEWTAYVGVRNHGAGSTSAGAREEQPSEGEKSGEPPGDFYVSREDITLKLPEYFARRRNEGLAIGDYEYLIAALPTAGAGLVESLIQESGDASASETEEAEREAEKAGERGEEAGEAPGPPEVDELTTSQRARLRDRLYRKLRRIAQAYEKSLAQGKPQDAVEAYHPAATYTALLGALARAVDVGLLGAEALREIVGSMVPTFTAKVWDVLDETQKDELESAVGCASVSLAAISAATSIWARRPIGEYDFDQHMHAVLRSPMASLRLEFLSLQSELANGKERPAWRTVVADYSKLGGSDRSSALTLRDLERRYRLWRLDEAGPLQRALEDRGIAEETENEGGRLLIRAPIPNLNTLLSSMRLLAYLTQQSSGESMCCVRWESTTRVNHIRRACLVVSAEERVAVQVYLYRDGRRRFEQHTVTPGTASSGFFLSNSRTIRPKDVAAGSRDELLLRAADACCR